MQTEPGSKRILVIRAGQLGDTIFATSVLAPLRAAYGEDAVIDWVAKRGMEGLFAADERIGRVFGVAHRNLPLPLNRDLLRIVRASYREPYDVLLNLELGDKFLTLVRLIRARRKFGRPSQFVADDCPEEHAVAHMRRICALAVAPTELTDTAPELRVAPLGVARQRLGLADRYLVLNPTNSHFLKNDYRTYRAWPVEHWHALMTRLLAERDEQVVLIGGRDEEEYFKLLEPLPAGVVSLVGRTSLPELMGVLAGAQAVVTTDTGPSHLAAAIGTPVLAIFGPSDHRKTGPYATADNVVRVLRVGLECSPCVFSGRLRTCPENRCMKLVSPAMVLEELAAISRAD